MWNKRPRRYHILQIELTEPLKDIWVPTDAEGVALVLRANDIPVGFLMEKCRPGLRIDRRTVAAKALETAGRRILAERIYGELRGPSIRRTFPGLDIAICTHQRTSELERCLESLRALGDVSVIVIDNAPRDKRTAEVVKKFPHVRYVVEPKPGLDFARNRAIREATGELLAFLDDDVVVDSGWLRGLQEAWAANPDAGGFTGPILPLALDTRAQITFERMGGFGKSFERMRFGSEVPDMPTYPVGAGIFGAGANMVFRRDLLEALGGFDEALDTGAPLPGGGDLDMFYRVVRAGHALVREPRLLVYHEHRREYSHLRHQMWTWGQGTMAYLTKAWRADPEARPKIRRWVVWWLAFQLSKMFFPYLRRNRGYWPWSMVLAEIFGAVAGLCGQYDRSMNQIEELRRQFT